VKLERPLVVASNRGPVSFDRDETGELVEKRGAGGLVTALTGALAMTGGLWVSCAMTDGDREQVTRSREGRIDVLGEDLKYDLRYLAPPPDAFDRYYNGISNRVLWFLHHMLWDLVRSPRFGAGTRQAWADYVRVNEEFAGALDEAAAGRDPAPMYLVQDYHLSLVPAKLRERRPDALISHFTHTPFAGPAYLTVLPEEMARELLVGLLGADILGFQSERWAELFLLSCRTLDDAKVDLRRRRVEMNGRTTQVRVYPISVDAPTLRELSREPDVRRMRRELAKEIGERKLILRVDRTELSKNILRGFLAFETLLKEHPEWVERVQMMALLNPSRREIPEYRAYTRECLSTAERINTELGTEDWKPIDVQIKNDYARALAAYGLYDVLMVNPVFDGMNLVAMEGPILNRRDGVVVLSRNAGGFELFGDHVLAVNPFDVEGQAEALHTALTMSADERKLHAARLRRAVTGHPLSKWVGRQLTDLERLASD
jgi:trehalose 6-phosphate synthase